MTTVTNKKLRNMNLTGRGAIVIEENILSEAERTLAEAVNPGQKYNCTVTNFDCVEPLDRYQLIVFEIYP